MSVNFALLVVAACEDSSESGLAIVAASSDSDAPPSSSLFARAARALPSSLTHQVPELLQELRNTDATTGMQRRTDLAARGVNVGASAVNSANAFIRRAEGKGKATVETFRRASVGTKSYMRCCAITH